MTHIHSTAIIRNRGQLTIPDKIRKVLKWTTPESVVFLSVVSNAELRIRSFDSQEKKRIDWEEVWRRIKRSQSLKGKQGNLSQFIIEDRERH